MTKTTTGDEMIYKENDLVTLKITASDAARLNGGRYTQIFPEQIIKHEPSPEPIVLWRFWGDGDDEEFWRTGEIICLKEWNHVEKRTLNPDGTYTVKVVK